MGFGIVAVAMVFALAAFVSSFVLPPVVTISATPNPAEINSTIIAIANDLSHTGIERLEIYENGIEVRECSISSCVYNAVHATPGNWSYRAYAVDNYGRTASSAAVVVSFSGNASINHAPILNPIGNKTIVAGNLLQFTISASDADGDALTYNASGVPAGASFNANTRTFSWTPNAGDLGTYYVVFSVSDGLASDFEMVRIDVVNAVVVDTDAPDWDNLIENPETGSEYSPNQSYEFNITWTDNVGVAQVWINFNGVNHTVTSANNVYSFSISDLAAGTYSYAWYARDASGNANTTGFIDYVVAKAIPQLSINILPSSSVTNGTMTTVTGINCPSILTCTLYREDAAVSNPDIATLSLGTYSYLYNTTGNENYSSESVLRTLIVSKTGGATGDGENDTGDIHTITDTEFRNGHYMYLDINDKVKFVFCGAPYYIKLTEIDDEDERAYFVLNPGTETFILDEGDKEEFDLNGNGVNDVLFRLESVSNSHKVKVYIKGLNDVCTGAQLLLNATNYESQGVDHLGAKESVLPFIYVLYLLMAGIFLIALAILIYLLSKLKRKK